MRTTDLAFSKDSIIVNIGDRIEEGQIAKRFSWFNHRTPQSRHRDSSLHTPRRALFTLTTKKKDYTIHTPRPAVMSFLAGVLVLALAVQLFTFAPQTAYGAYTANSQDADGNYHLSSNTVTDTYFYDRSQDSSEDTQRALGVDPNWATGVTRKSFALKFDGSDDYVMVNDSDSLEPNDNLTVEAWIKPASLASEGRIISKTHSSDFAFVLNGAASGDCQTSQLCFYLRLGSSYSITNVASSSLTANQWHHIAASWDGATLRMFIDGSQVDSVAASGTITHSSAPICFGEEASGSDCTEGGNYNGILDEVRISDIARYTSAFIPSRRHTEDTNTRGLWHFDEGESTSAHDASQYGNTGTLAASTAAPVWVTGANAIMDGFNSEHRTPSNETGAGNISLGEQSSDSSDKSYEMRITGSNALSFDGSDYISVTDATALDITGSITMEAWIYPTAWPSGGSPPNDYGTIVTKSNNYYFHVNSSGKLAVYLYGTSNPGYHLSTSTLSLNRWTHVAAVFNGSTLRFFIDGALDTTVSVTGSLTASDYSLGIGANLSTNGTPVSGYQRYFAGHIDEVRVSSSARYSTPFTPQRRFSTDAATAGLWHLDEGSGQTTIDSSGNSQTGTLGETTGESTDDPTWVEGIATTPNQTSDSTWALPNYAHRKRVSIATTDAISAGHAVETTENRATIMNNKQTRADGRDWRIVYQPSDATRSLTFDGANDYVTIPHNTNLNPGTSDFTLEAWVKGNNMADTDVILAKSNGGSAATDYGYLFGVFDSLKPTLYFATSATAHTKIQATTSLENGKWYHLAVAVDRDSTTNTKFYINGLADSSTSVTNLATNTGSITNTVSLTLGSESDTGFYWDGQIDEPRISSGIRYSGDFTPGTTPFTSDNTTLGLWHLDEGDSVQIADASGSEAHGYLGADATDDGDTEEPIWNSSGRVSTTREIPRFIPNGHTLDFDGGDVVTVTGWNTTIAEAYTLEAWVMPSTGAAGSRNEIIRLGYASGNSQAEFYYNPSTQQFCWGTYQYNTACSTSTFAPGSWYHVAGVHIQGTAYLYVNGQLEASFSSPSGPESPSLTHLRIGNDTTSQAFTGQIDEVRLSSTARYRNEFTPLTTPFASDANTIALYHFDEGSGQTITDSSSNGYNGTRGASSSESTDDPTWVTNGGKVKSTNQTQFKTVAPVGAATSSKDYYLYYGNPNEGGNAQSYESYGLKFDDSDDYLTAGTHNAAYPFTLVAYVKPSSSGAIISINRMNSTSARVYLGINGSGKAILHTASTTASSTATGATTVTGGYHTLVGVFNSATDRKLYVDGILDASDTTNIALASGTNTLRIGATEGSSGVANHYGGEIAETRVYSRALTTTEIASLHTNTSAVSNLNLGGQWKFEEGTPVSTTSADNSTTGNTATLNNFNFNASSNWVVNKNLVEVTTEPTQTTVVTEQESPVFYQWRDVSYPSGTISQGSWSTRAQIPTSETQLGSSGVYVRFNPMGRYSKGDYYKIASWAVEAFSTSVPRGQKNAFPLKANIITTDTGTDIIDAETNKVWMRFSEGYQTLGYINPSTVVAKDGQIYVGLGAIYGLVAIQFDLDSARKYSSSGNAVFKGNIADRNDSLDTETLAGSTIRGTSTNDVDVAVINNKHYVALAFQSAGGTSVIHNVTAFGVNNTSGTVTSYGSTSWHPYSNIAISSGGELYASNVNSTTLNRWDNVHADTSNQLDVAADKTYSTSSTPALRSGAINALSITEGTSTAENGQNTIAVAHDLGVDVIQEHSTQSSETVRHYTRTGETGSSNWSSKQFGGAALFDGTNDQIVANSTYSLGTSNVTLEAWVYLPSESLEGAFIKVGNASSGYGIGVGGSQFDNPGNDLIGLYENWRWIDTNVAIGTGWHHVAMVINGSGVPTFYLDGTAVLTSPGTTPSTPSTSTYIGGYDASCCGGDTRYTTGMIDEVRISSTARYSANFTPSRTPFTNDDSTAALFHLDDMSGQTVTNAAGGTNGTLGTSGSADSADPKWVAPALAGASDKTTAVSMHATSNDEIDYFWAGTNGSSTNDGALTAISLTTHKQITAFTDTDSGLPDLDISSLSLGSGGLALVGTEVGAWNPGTAGFVVDDTAASPVTQQNSVRVKSGGTRIKSGGVRIRRSE